MNAQDMFVIVCVGIMVIGFGYVTFIAFPKIEKENREKEEKMKKANKK